VVCRNVFLDCEMHIAIRIFSDLVINNVSEREEKGGRHEADKSQTCDSTDPVACGDSGKPHLQVVHPVCYFDALLMIDHPVIARFAFPVTICYLIHRTSLLL